MSYVIKGRMGITTQIPASFAIKLGETAEVLGITRHRLTILAMVAGLEIAAAQVRAERAAKAAKQPSADAKE